jgi:glyoxylase-like metal-dependent hydrolase (beta-lactamase superfamily II)
MGDRDVCLFLVVGTSSAALVDTGVAGSPEAVLAPALAALDVDVSHIVVTHADVDHSGGLAAARALAPRAVAACHALDRPLVDSVDRLIDERYRELRHAHEIDPDAAFCDWVRANDDGGAVDAVLTPPTHIDLGDRRLAILHTPGHTRGHLTVVDEATGTAIVADAVMAGGVPDASGEPAFAPTYRYVADYRASCEALRRLAPARLLCSHFSVVEGPADVAAFLDETDSFAVRLEEAILEALAAAPDPMRATDLVAAAAPRVRTWDPGMDWTLAHAVVGHLEDLVARGLVKVLPGHPATFATVALQ